MIVVSLLIGHHSIQEGSTAVLLREQRQSAELKLVGVILLYYLV